MSDKRAIQSPINGRKGGRPQSRATLCAQELRERFAERVYAKADALFDAWESAAVGDFVEVKTAKGITRVYCRSPNPKALQSFLEQVWGKPKQIVEVPVEDEPEWDFDAVRRMGKYVDLEDAEYRRILALVKSHESVASSSTIDLSRYKIQKKTC